MVQATSSAMQETTALPVDATHQDDSAHEHPGRAHPSGYLIVGPTAGGKSALALALAHALAQHGTAAELVSADSMQVYRGMDIGTAKPTPRERARTPHHLIDIRDPTQPFSVSEWLDLAQNACNDIRARAGLPIVVGGTHLYAKAFLEGLFRGPEPDEAIRADLDARELPQLRAELERVDPAAAARIHPNDRRRTVRALEVYRQTGTPISQLQQQWDAGRERRDIRLIGLEWPSETINRRINARVRTMIDLGLVEEVRALWADERLGPQAREAIGYKQLIDHFRGRCPLDEAIERIKIESRRLAKNQRTWLRRLRPTPGAVWLDAEGFDAPELAERALERGNPAAE